MLYENLIVVATIICCHGNRFPDISTGFYHVPDNQKVIYDVDLGHDIHKRAAATQPLRIHLHFDRSILELPYEHQKLIKEKVNIAVEFWEDTLMIHPTSSPIRLNRKCLTNDVRYFEREKYCKDGCALTTCGDIIVPLPHLQSCKFWDSIGNEYYSPDNTESGVANADFILYVAALSSEKCLWEKTVAFAAHCQLEKSLDRPIAGYFSICPHSLSTSIHKHEELLYTIKHEILHALGFTTGLYAFYRDINGQPLTERDPHTGKPLAFNKQLGMYQWSNRVVKEFTRYNWRLKGQSIKKNVHMIVTDNVVREVRRHFNCSTLEGGELEDQGINGTAFTHWEKRVFENEFMTGTYTQNPVISRISLALMEDTGWYSVKYWKAGDLEWGQNLGCDFVTKSCYEWIETRMRRQQDIHPFCTAPNRGEIVTDCSRNRNAVAICNLSEFPVDLPEIYQYFSSIPGVHPSNIRKYGGGVSLADYCPYLQEFVWKENENYVRGSRCALKQNMLEQKHNHLLEKYSPNAKCFNHGSAWIVSLCPNMFNPHYGSGCYEYQCSLETGLTIAVMGRVYQCSYTGQVLRIRILEKGWLYQGTIVCPSCEEMCKVHGVQCPPEDYRNWSNQTYQMPCGIATFVTFTLFKYLYLVYILLYFL